MLFLPTPLSGVFVVELECISDNRGFFARSFCAREFKEHGLHAQFVQCNVSGSRLKGTVRGLHYQLPPASEVKFVRCTRGALYDVVVDLRQDSPTYLQHFGVTLSADKRSALYVPEQFAHGFQTLAEDTEVFYQMGSFYSPEYSTGLRYDDPRLRIPWPLPVTAVSEKDLAWPLLVP